MNATTMRTGRNRLAGSDVDARRAAALDRLNGGQRRNTPRRARPMRRSVPAATTRRTEELGPPPATYYAIGVTVALFVMLGLVMVLSATSANQVGFEGSPYAIFQRQAMWAALGGVGMLVVLTLPYQRWRTLVIPGSVLAAGAMMLPFVPGVGATINNANSWVRFGSFGFQPSEFLKLAAIVFLADFFARHADEVALPRYGIWPLSIVGAGCAGVSFIQGDLGSAIVLASIVLSVGLIAGIPYRHVAIASLVGIAGAAIGIATDPRRVNRFTAFLDLEGNKDHLAYQPWQAMLSIANGGVTGSGIGGSNSKLGYLPLAHSDFIFAVVADELGFIGSLTVIGGFGVLVWLGIQTALAAPDRFGMITAGGIAAWLGVQAVVNLGGVAGLMPVTGLTLPFFSAGGTSLFTSMLAAALLLNIARRAVTDPRRETGMSAAWRRLGRGQHRRPARPASAK